MALAFSSTWWMYLLNMGVEACRSRNHVVWERKIVFRYSKSRPTWPTLMFCLRISSFNWICGLLLNIKDLNTHLDLFEGDSHPSNGMVVRSSLKWWKHSKVHPVLEVIEDFPAFLIHGPHTFPVEDQASPAEKGHQTCLAGYVQNHMHKAVIWIGNYQHTY